MNADSNMTLQINKDERTDAFHIIEYLNIVGGESDNLLFGANGFHMIVEAEEAFIDSFMNLKSSALFVGKVENEIVCIGSVISSPKERIAHQAELAISVKKKYWSKGII